MMPFGVQRSDVYNWMRQHASDYWNPDLMQMDEVNLAIDACRIFRAERDGKVPELFSQVAADVAREFQA